MKIPRKTPFCWYWSGKQRERNDLPGELASVFMLREEINPCLW
jgi:hypothetical protein